MLRELYRKINERNSPYYDIYYLTDTEVRFSLKDNNRILTYSVRFENNKYNFYGFEKSKIPEMSNIIRHKMLEIKNIDEFWICFNNFNNNLY